MTRLGQFHRHGKCSGRPRCQHDRPGSIWPPRIRSVATDWSFANVFDQLMALSSYVLENGPVLKHGQTFGPSADERYSIEVGPSLLGKAGTVIRLGL